MGDPSRSAISFAEVLAVTGGIDESTGQPNVSHDAPDHRLRLEPRQLLPVGRERSLAVRPPDGGVHHESVPREWRLWHNSLSFTNT